MARERHPAEEIIEKLRQVDVLIAQGRQVADAVRAIGVPEVTYYRWCKEYGRLKGDRFKRHKELETENTGLRRTMSDLTLDYGVASQGWLDGEQEACRADLAM